MPTDTSPPTRSEEPLDDALAGISHSLLSIIRQANLGRLHERVCRDTGVHLERARFSVLAWLSERGPASLSDVAHGARLDISTASRHIAHLERIGFVERAAHPTDGRVVALAVTPEGADIVQRLRRGWQLGLSEMLSGWPADERRDLARYLARLADDVVRYSDEQPVRGSR